MQAQPSRKSDRRTIYTRNTVKEALLDMLEERSYEKITVAALCRHAEITRSTFYLHFRDMDTVLDELLGEALMVAESAASDMSMIDRMKALEQLAYAGGADMLKQNERILGPCQRVADDPKYRVIFQDPTLSSYIIHRIYKLESNAMVPYLMERCNLRREEADRLFMMLVYGLFYMNQSLKWNKNDNWYEMQLLVVRLLFGGFDALQKRNNIRPRFPQI